MMDDSKKRFQIGFIGSLGFHLFVFLVLAFAGLFAANHVDDKIVEIAVFGGGGGGGGGGDENEKEYLMQLEKWFNWLRRIEELENRITVLRAKRENLKDGKQYANSIYEENAYLKK